mmetsp:Transcript_127401/g.254511  ORF Transcript_127401/g.254511 Transcript_127401/m.254511 type:complete len:201 (-) Transcript_127401:359-961(-)
MPSLEESHMAASPLRCAVNACGRLQQTQVGAVTSCMQTRSPVTRLQQRRLFAPRASTCAPSGEQDGGDGPTTDPRPSRLSITFIVSNDVAQTTPSSAWLTTKLPLCETVRPTTPLSLCTSVGRDGASPVLGSHVEILPSAWPATTTPKLAFTAAPVTGPAVRIVRSVCPRSRSQSRIVLSALAVNAVVPPLRKPQALTGP